MKRGWVYLVFGPFFGVLGMHLWAIVRDGADAALRDPAEGVVLAYIFGFLVSWLSFLIDEASARVVPIMVRAPLIAASGSAVAFGVLSLALGKAPSLQHFMQIGVVAASSTGICSLLANKYWKP